MASKLRTRGALVRKILPPHQKGKEKERPAPASHLPRQTEKKKWGAGGRLLVVNFQSNEWALPKICHPLALHVVNIQLQPHRRPLFAPLSPSDIQETQKTPYLLLSSPYCSASMRQPQFSGSLKKDSFMSASLMNWQSPRLWANYTFSDSCEAEQVKPG